MSLFLALAEKLGISFVADWLRRSAPKAIPRLTSRRKYLQDLVSRVREMPFIYRDLEGEVLTDFVEITYSPIDLREFGVRSHDLRLGSTLYERMRQFSRVLIVGSAGIGKTTFERYAILNIIELGTKSPFLNPREVRIPVYIPLKAVDNSAPMPILRYIQESVAFFKAEKGIRRLARFAEAGRLFLFLDGYDEIPFTSAGTNFVQQELQALFFPRSVIFKPGREEAGPFYAGIEKCRVWLSSRKEFLEQNQIIPEVLGPSAGVANVAAVELRGVGNNRLRLADNIFEKYRRRTPAFRQYLDSEYFLYRIDETDDEEIRQMSFNPLFLTVMCYLYVEKALEEMRHDVNWLTRFDDLILECTRLLLRDLDKYRARDLPEARRAALERRRSPYFEEKIDFLHHFAALLFAEGRAVFSLTYLREQVRAFFTDSSSPHAAHILRELHESTSTRPDFALQLVYCGILIIVDRRVEGPILDFPHRRFREVLAAKYYFHSPDRYGQLLGEVHEKRYEEFRLLFPRFPEFQNPHYHEAALEWILREMKHGMAAEVSERITRNFVAFNPPPYDSSPIERFLLEMLRVMEPKFTLASEMVSSVDLSEALHKAISNCLSEAISAGTASRLSLSLALKTVYEPWAVTVTLDSLRELMQRNREFRAIWMKYALRSKPQAILDDPRSILKDEEDYDALFHLIGAEWSRIPERETFLEQIAHILSAEQRLRLQASTFTHVDNDLRRATHDRSERAYLLDTAMNPGLSLQQVTLRKLSLYTESGVASMVTGETLKAMLAQQKTGEERALDLSIENLDPADICLENIPPVSIFTRRIRDALMRHKAMFPTFLRKGPREQTQFGPAERVWPRFIDDLIGDLQKWFGEAFTSSDFRFLLDEIMRKRVLGLDQVIHWQPAGWFALTQKLPEVALLQQSAHIDTVMSDVERIIGREAQFSFSSVVYSRNLARELQRLPAPDLPADFVL